jgi:hypothetical protein
LVLYKHLAHAPSSPAAGTAAVAAWRFAVGTSAGDAEALRFLSASHASFILNASERPLWFHHAMALAPASSVNVSSQPLGTHARLCRVFKTEARRLKI